MNIAMASFNTTVRQMTKMSQQKNDRNVSANKSRFKDSWCSSTILTKNISQLECCCW